MARKSLASIYEIGLILCLGLSACGGGGSPTTPPPTNPTPTISSFSPANIAAGNNGFTLTVRGSGFGNSSSVSWNSSARPTTLVSSTELSAAITAADISAMGTATVVVSNPTPGGGQASTSFPITAPEAPSLSSVAPNPIMVGTSAPITVTGGNFVQGTVVQWNGTNRPTTYVSNTQLVAQLNSTDVAVGGHAQVAANTPAPGGGTSDPAQVTVEYPLPAINGLNPSLEIVDSGAFTLTVNGSNFASGAVVYWNNISRTTTFVNSTQLTASILASDITTVGSDSVTVHNPDPSAGISNVAVFNVGNVVPVLSSIDPTSALAGPAQEINVYGSGFSAESTIQLAGQTVPKYFVDSGHLIARVLNALPVATLQITVTNPPPGGGTSNSLDFDSIAAGPPGSLAPVSLDSSGNIIEGDSSAISSQARYVAFSSYNFLTNTLLAYTRDTCINGPQDCVPSTLSRDEHVTPPDYSTEVGISDDGRYVLFEPSFSGNSASYALRFFDTCLGMTQCSPTIQPIGSGVLPNSTQLTPDGRYIAYGAGNLSDYVQTHEIDIYDTCVGALVGCTPANYKEATGYRAASLSADGRYIAYDQLGTTLTQIVLHDSCFGASVGCVPGDTVLSDVSKGFETPRISADGLFVAYFSQTIFGQDVPSTYLENTCAYGASACTPTAELVSSPPATPFTVLVSDGGRYVAYTATNATIAGHTVVQPQTFIYDSCKGAVSGCVPQTVPVCLSSTGALADTGCSLQGLTRDGQYLLIQSGAVNLSTKPDGVGSVVYVTKNPLL